MKNNFPKIPLFISITLFIFSCLAFLFLFREIKSNKDKAQIASEEWQKEENHRENIKSLDDSIHMIERERGQLNMHFAQSSDIVPFLDAVESLASPAGVLLEVTSVDMFGDKNGLLINMRISGNFGSLYKFITLLENFSYEVEFISVDLQKKENADVSKESIKNPKWEASIKVKLLSFIQ